MTTIVPHIWTDGTALQAAGFYQSVFRDARETARQHYPTEHLPDFQRDKAGQVLTVELDVHGRRIALINAGSEFRPNPAAGFMVNFAPAHMDDAAEYLDAVYAKLTDGGSVLMELAEYPFSPRYAWVEDRYGVSWQLILTNPEGEPRPVVLPALMFCGPAQNRAAEAVAHYTSLFPGSRAGNSAPYPEQTGPAVAGALMFSDFRLGPEREDPREEFWVTAMDSAVEQDFTFTEGLSLLVEADGQEELDRLWAALSASPDHEQCGWCRDEFGLSWQVVPTGLYALLERPGAYQALLGMKKIDIAGLPET
ncbi:VOC family protein [Brevibacterium album]|uniref:VOC family protein n=1 Tax=Brevibacterium album TaxID=417948 RepID=UPI000400F135|nr:VOC family protein [Brevibacterium album]